jgi:hypothetical protein
MVTTFRVEDLLKPSAIITMMIFRAGRLLSSELQPVGTLGASNAERVRFSNRGLVAKRKLIGLSGGEQEARERPRLLIRKRDRRAFA